MTNRAVAKFIVPNWGDKVDSGVGLSYLPASLCSLAGRYDNPMPESTENSLRDYEFGYRMQIRIRTKMSRIRNTGFLILNFYARTKELHAMSYLFTRVLDPYPDPDPHGSALILVAGSGSGSRRAKMTHKNRKKVQNFHV